MDFWKQYAGKWRVFIIFFLSSFVHLTTNSFVISLLNFRQTQSPNLLRQENDFCIYVLNVIQKKVEAMRSAPEYKQIKYSKSNFKYLCDISALLLKHYIKVLPNMINDQSVEMAHASIDCFRECLTTAVVLYERKFTDFLKVLSK